MARAKATARKRKRKPVEFDEQSVQAEMAAALEEEVDYIFLDKENWYGQTYYVLDLHGDTYHIFRSDDAAHEAAVDRVREDLRSEPEIFNQDWLMTHVDEKALKEWVYDAVLEDEYFREIAGDDPDRFWEEAARWGVKVPKRRPKKIPESKIEEAQEAYAKERAEDPMDFLEDIYGREEATKKAMDIVGIDIEAAANEAVSSDGWPHFLSTYDGGYDTTESGFVYFRV